MVDGIYVNHITLEECIAELKSITVRVGGDEVSRLLSSLESTFGETNSDTAIKLLSVKEQYTIVNNLLIAIANNAIDVLTMAKATYKHADAEMLNHIGSASALEAAKAELAATTGNDI